MIKRTLFFLFIVVSFLVSTPNVNAQLFNDNSAMEPVINAQAQYDKGLIRFSISVPENSHITDIKNGFFKIALQENEFISINRVDFPTTVPFGDENVFKGDLDIPVFIKQLKELTDPVTLKFTVHYQICQERPQELCYPPNSKEIDIKLETVFKEVKIEEKNPPINKASTEESNTSHDSKNKKSATSYKPKGGNWVFLLLLGFVLLLAAVLIGLIDFSDEDDIGTKFVKSLAVLLLVTGAFLFIKALDIKFYPLKYSEKQTSSIQLNWLSDIEEGKVLAKKENKTLLVDSSAEWCVACKELEEYTFSHPDVAKIMDSYVLVKLDFTSTTPEEEKIRKELNIKGMPTIILFDNLGNELRRTSGFREEDEFQDFLGGKMSWFDKMIQLLKQELEKKSLFLFLLIFFLGFLTSLTPCVYPVIPIVMGYIGTRSGKKKLKGLYLSLFFVLGLAVVYSIFGLIAGMTGSMVGVSFQNPIVVIIISAIFVIMGLSLAGLFEIPVPSSISSKMQGGSGSGEVLGAIIVGGVSGIIAAPCVGPVLIALLSWISESKDIFLGFLLTFIFSLGMGIIFLLAGTFSGVLSAMPKGGNWMNYIKYFFAVLLTGGGIFILNPILPMWISLLLWGIFLLTTSVFIGLFKPLEEFKLKNKIYKFIILLLFLVGIFMFYKSIELKFFTLNAPGMSGIESVQPAPPTPDLTENFKN